MNFYETEFWLPHATKPNHNIGYSFAQGWLFAKVLETEIVPYDYTDWDYLAASTDDSEYNVLVDSDSKEIFEVNKPNVLAEVFTGINDPLLRMQVTLPQPKPSGILQNSIGAPAIGAIYGWQFDGEQSPWENPTVMSRTVIPYKSIIAWALSNDALTGIQPVTRHYINYLNIVPLDPRKMDQQETIVGILKAGGRGHIPATLFSSGLTPFQYPTFENVYKVPPVEYNGIYAWYTGADGKQHYLKNMSPRQGR